MFSSLSCSSCGFVFPPNVIHNACPKCGSNPYKSGDSNLATSVSIRYSYALKHIQAATLHTRNSGALEDEYAGSYSGLRFFDDNEAFVTSAVFSTVAFLETTINDFFADIAEGHNKDFQELHKNDDIATQIQKLWKMDIPRTAAYSILEKYQIALILTKKEVFDRGSEIYQNVDLLITLRNHLIHAEPENHHLFTVGEIEPPKAVKSKLSEGLKGRFPINKLMENLGNPFFPYKCLGHGCAEWGIQSSLKFTDEFFLRIGLKPSYDGLREKLKTKWIEH
jgi:predicted  nucleic acid-binding Zn-ribbon protein